MSNMDLFDEFEFKPLTDGLGFHKKAMSLKEGLKSTGVLDEELQGVPSTIPQSMLEDTPKAPAKKHTFEDVLSALEKTPLTRNPELQFTEALPRKAMEIETPRPIQSPFPQPNAYKNPINIPPHVEKVGEKVTPKPAAAEKTGTRRGAADSPKRNLMPASASISAAMLDGVIVFALTLVFLIALVMVTKIDLNSVIRNVSHDFMTQVSLGVLAVAVMQMYAIIARSFFGRTLGEWTFDLQIGRDEEQQKESYPLKIAWRCVINTATGLVILPAASLLVGHDIAGQLSGVELYRQRT